MVARGAAYLSLVRMAMVPLEIGLLLSFVLIGLGFGDLGDECSDGEGMHCGIICLSSNFQKFYLCRPWYVHEPRPYCALVPPLPL